MSAPMSSDTRKVPPQKMWRVVELSLGRMACAYSDPSYNDHDHATCLWDDEAYAAELVLEVVAAACVGNNDALLDAAVDLLDAVTVDDAG